MSWSGGAGNKDLNAMVDSGEEGPSDGGASPSAFSALPLVGGAKMAFSVPEATRSAMMTAKAGESATYTWDDVPPCPIRGYILDERGLIDLEGETPSPKPTRSFWGKQQQQQVRGHIMSKQEVLELATECAKYESATRAVKDRRWDDGMQSGQERMAAELGFYFSMLTSFVLFGYAARYFPGAYPRSSVLFKRVFTKERGYTEEHLQAIARRYRRPLMATTPMMVMLTTMGGTVLGLAALLKPGKAHVGETEAKAEIETAKIAMGQAREAALYVWNVYYHHPVYTK